MQFLCIGVNGSTDLVMQHINEELRQLKNKKISYSINEINSEGSASIICTINDGRFYREKSLESYKVLKTYISNALADYIIRQYEEKLIMRIINSNFCYFNAAEKKEILQRALSIIRNEDKTFINSLFQIRRRNVIVRRLMDYFDNSNSIILDGFVNFRLKDYIKDLEEIVDKAVDDFLMDREYREFIRLLRYFVEIQEPKIDTVHVIVNYDNKYTLLDGSKREITNECIQEYVNEITEGEINYDDLLVSSLITFAPRKVVIHSKGNFRNKELMETIKNVFYGRVIICQGCELCSVRMAKSETKK
jgi:putative sporulation protein YtxC